MVADAADDADGIVHSCTHPDDPASGSAFATKRNVDAQYPQERLRATQAASERAGGRIHGICARGIPRRLVVLAPQPCAKAAKSRDAHVYKVAPAVRVGQTITMHFAIASNGNFVPTVGTATARVRLFLEQQGDTLTAQEPYKRWWSVTSAELHEGEFTLTASLSPDQWTSVFGQGGAEVPNEFNAAISQVANVGFTFGGAFAGHGVYVTGGNARFILKQYSEPYGYPFHRCSGCQNYARKLVTA